MTKEANNTQGDLGGDFNWSAITNDFGDQPIVTEKPAQTTEQTTETVEEVNTETEQVAESKPETEKPETTSEEKPEEVKEKVADEKPETEKVPEIEFDANEILKDIQEPEDGTWLAVAKHDGLEVKEDSWEAVKAAIIEKEVAPLKAEYEQKKQDLYAGLDPEVAAAFKLMEMGIPKDQILEPTKTVDTYLAMEDAQIVRENLKALGHTDEFIDAEMELLGEKNLVTHEAAKIRHDLNLEKQKIINSRSQLVEQFTAQREQALLRQKEETTANLTKALSTASEFMGVKLKDEVRDAIVKKFNSGHYNDVISNPTAVRDAILYKELGPQIIKSIKNTAFEQGRDTIAKKLSNIPPITGTGTGKVVDVKNQLNNNDPFAAIAKDFGG